MDMSMKNKNKGFTLVELLGVIVVLAVIALITTPMIVGVIDKAKKGALEDSAYGLIDSANLYYANNMLEGTNEKTEFTFSNGEQTSEEKLSIKGKVEEGNVRLYSDGKIALCITEGDYAAVKNIGDNKVSVIKGRCSYNAETEEYETVGLCQDLQDELADLKQAHEEEIATLTQNYEAQIKQLEEDYEAQKATIEETYKDQIEALNQQIAELEETHNADLEELKNDYEGQLKTQQETYEQQITELTNQKTELQTEINRINGLGNATATQILTGKTAYVKGQLVTGTMTNNGTITKTLNSGGSYTIPAGYHSGSGKVTVNSLASQTSATATAADIASGKTAWVNGTKITGTKSNPTPTITTNFTATSDGYANVYIYGYAFNLQDVGVYTNGVINVYEDSTVVATLTVSKSGKGGTSTSKLVQIPIKKGCKYYSTITQSGWLENSGSTVASSVVFSYVAE